MSWRDRFRQALIRFFQGRNGPDQLGFAALILALILNVLDGFLGLGVLSLLSTALFIWAVFRMLSRNVERRREENSRFTGWWYPLRKRISQFWTRLKNTRKYKYFRCPECRAILRLKRGSGTVHVTCGKCRHEFDQKA